MLNVETVASRRPRSSRIDFKSGGHSGAKCKVKIDAPGVFMVRYKTRDTQSDHEYFAAIDLVVEKDEKK